jgi:hypothetical protein
MQVMSCIPESPSHPKRSTPFVVKKNTPTPKCENGAERSEERAGSVELENRMKVEIVSLSFVRSREKQKPVQARVDRRAAQLTLKGNPKKIETVNPVPN